MRLRSGGLIAFIVSCGCLSAAPPAVADDRITDLVPVEPGTTAQDACEGYPPYYGCYSAMSVTATNGPTFFTSARQLTLDDTDTDTDLYARSGADVRLVSKGAGFGSLAATNDDGSVVYWNTNATLVPEDTDTLTDIYRSAGGGPPELVSTGPADNGDVSAAGGRLAPDGSRFFFTTSGVLTPGDTNAYYDVYERAGGATRLVSGGGQCPSAQSYCGAYFLEASDDGTTVAFGSARSWTGDVDSTDDYYLTSLTTGSWTSPDLASSNPGQSTTQHLREGHLTGDGTRFYFISFDPLAPGARSGDYTLYVHTTSGIQLAFPGPQGCPPNCGVGLGYGLSRDGTHVFFSSGTQLVPEDTDSTFDLYQRVGDTTTLLTPGPPSCGINVCYSSFRASSTDGSRVIFASDDRLAPTDHDGDYDLYEVYAGTITHLTPDAAPSGSSYPTEPEFIGASADAKRVVFTTGDRLTTDDNDPPSSCFYDDGDSDYWFIDCVDVYARENGVFTLLSKGPSGTNAALEAYREPVSASQDAQHVAFVTHETLTADDSDGGYDDFYVSQPAVTSPPYIRPRGASPMYLSLVPAFGQCTAPNATHGAPLAFGSCTGPTQASPNLTMGTPDANGQGAKSVGAVTIAARAGNSSTPPDEADIRVKLFIGDVRRSADLSDYTGEIAPRVVVRLTDRDGGIPSTTEFPFSYPVPCSGTASTAVGSDCALTTTADSVVPGLVTESQRSVWALDRFDVYDGGADGDADTPGDNARFLTQGVFIP